jgi:hypothetical protein
MMDDNTQPIESAAPESSAPVSDTADTSSATPASSPSRPHGGRGSRKSATSATTGDKFAASLEQTYNRIQARGDSGQQSPAVSADIPGPSLEEVYGRRDAALNELASNFDTLPEETKAYLRTAIDRLPMPQAWSQDKAEAWAKLDPVTQKYISERELQAAQKISELGQAKSSPFDEVVQRYSSHIPRGPDGNPMPAQSVLDHLLAAHAMLESQPGPAIQALANSYGIDLRQMAHDPQAAAQQQQIVSQYAQQVQHLQAQVAQLQSQRSQYQSQRAQWLQQQALEYLKDKEYSPEFENEIHHQVAAIRDRNPAQFEIDPMSVLREAERRAYKFTGHGDKSSAEEAKKKADEAKRLGSMNVKSKIGRSPSGVSGDMWSPDNWEAAYSKASGR